MNAAIFAVAAAAVEAVEHGAKKPGLPQLNPNDFAPQLIWLVLTFALLYIVMSRVALPRVGEVLDERKGRIDRDLEAASRLKAETDQALADYEQALATARGNASAVAKEAREASAAASNAERKTSEAALAAKLAAAETRIADTKSKAMQSVETVAAETASAIVEKLIGQSVTVEDARKAVAARS